MALESLDGFGARLRVVRLPARLERTPPVGDRLKHQPPSIFLRIGPREIDLGQDRVFHRTGERRRGREGQRDAGQKPRVCRKTKMQLASPPDDLTGLSCDFRV